MKPLVSPGKSYALDARGVVRAYRKPGARAFARFGARNANGVRTVFAGIDAVLGARCRAVWYRVLLPMKPNGSMGYVRATRVKLRIVRSRIVIDLSSRRVAAYDRGRLALTTTAAIGAPATPTPLGRFYINQRFRDDPNGPYGWAAIGISAFSEVLTGLASRRPRGAPRDEPSVAARPARLKRLHSRLECSDPANLVARANRNPGSDQALEAG